MQLELWNFGSMTRHNVFFAFRPPVAASAQITRLMQGIVDRLRLGATLQTPERLHVSLIGVGDFTGPLPVSVIEAAKAAVGALRIAPFDVTFTSVAHFGGDAIVLQARAGDKALMTLREALRLALWKAGVRLPAKARNGFAPHVTMAYGERVPEFPVDPVSWTVDALVLIDSWIGQSKHVTLGRWPLSA
jgi:RNA 2',3'-cyclic 3'-phosphodiesterase